MALCIYRKVKLLVKYPNRGGGVGKLMARRIRDLVMTHVKELASLALRRTAIIMMSRMNGLNSRKLSRLFIVVLRKRRLT